MEKTLWATRLLAGCGGHLWDNQIAHPCVCRETSKSTLLGFFHRKICPICFPVITWDVEGRGHLPMGQTLFHQNMSLTIPVAGRQADASFIGRSLARCHVASPHDPEHAEGGKDHLRMEQGFLHQQMPHSPCATLTITGRPVEQSCKGSSPVLCSPSSCRPNPIAPCLPDRSRCCSVSFFLHSMTPPGSMCFALMWFPGTWSPTPDCCGPALPGASLTYTPRPSHDPTRPFSQTLVHCLILKLDSQLLRCEVRCAAHHGLHCFQNT